MQLVEAAMRGDAAGVKTLLASGVKADTPDSSERTALAYAAPYLEGGTEGYWRSLGLGDDEIELGRTGMTDLTSALIRQRANQPYVAPTG